MGVRRRVPYLTKKQTILLHCVKVSFFFLAEIQSRHCGSIENTVTCYVNTKV